MRRRLTLLTLWVAGTAAATLVVWLGVRVVDEEVTALPAAVPVSSPSTTTPVAVEGTSTSVVTTSTTDASTQTTRVASRPPTTVGGSAPPPPGPAAPPPAPAPTSTTTTATTAPPATTRTFNGQGGSATIRFTSTTVELIVATPSSGFEMEIDDGGPARVRVEFRSDDHETRIEASAGDSTARVDERGQG